MATQTQKQAWFLAGAGLIASFLGTMIEQKMIPAPWDGFAVAVGVFLASITRGPASDPVPQLDTERLLAELDKRRRRSTTPPRPMPPVVPPQN